MNTRRLLKAILIALAFLIGVAIAGLTCGCASPSLEQDDPSPPAPCIEEDAPESTRAPLGRPDIKRLFKSPTTKQECSGGT